MSVVVLGEPKSLRNWKDGSGNKMAELKFQFTGDGNEDVSDAINRLITQDMGVFIVLMTQAEYEKAQGGKDKNGQ